MSFEASIARFWMRNEHLQLRLPSGDRSANALYRRQCDQLLLGLQQEQASRGALTPNTLQLHALQEEDGEESL